MVEEVASVCDKVEFLHGVPVKLPSQTKALLRGKIRTALTQAYQAGIDEAVEKTQAYCKKQITIQDHFLNVFDMAPFDWHRGRKIEAEEMLEFLNNTIKVLQNNK